MGITLLSSREYALRAYAELKRIELAVPILLAAAPREQYIVELLRKKAPLADVALIYWIAFG